MKKSFSKTIAVLLAVLMVVCSLPLTVLAADETRSNVQLQFGAYYASGEGHQTYVDTNYIGFGDSGLKTAKLDYNKASGTITEASSGHTYGVGDFFTVSVLLENTSSLAAAQVGIKYSDNIVPAAVGYDDEGNQALFPASDVSEVVDENFAPNEAITEQSGNAIYNTDSSTVGELSYIDADANTMWANFAVQDGTDAADVSSTTIGVNTYTNTAVLATFGFKIVGDGAVTFSLADTKDIDSAYYVETIANGGKVEEYKTYTTTDYDGSTALDFMGDNENIESKKYTVKFVDENGATISEAEYTEGAAVTAPALPATTHDDDNHYTYSWDVTPAATATADATYTRVKTAAAHTWDAGVKQSDGSTLYTCTFDGCGATKSEAAEHVHTWGEWTYNGDAKYDTATKTGTDGTQTRVCSECGESETVTAPNTGLLVRQATQLSIDSAIMIKTWVRKDICDYFDSFYMSVTYPTKEGDKTEVVEECDTGTSKGVTYYRFSFDKIMPHYLNEEAKYTFYGVKDGVTYWGDTYEYAVTTYLKAQLDKYNTTSYPSTYSNYRRLLADIIWYGYKAQIQQGYGITDGKKTPMTDYITAEQLSYRTTTDLTLESIDDKNYATIDNPSAQIGTNLRMGASVDLVVVMAKKTSSCPDLDTLKVEVTKEGSEPEIYTVQDNPKMFAKSGNYLNFYYNGVKGNEASVPVYVRLLDADGNAVSNTRRMNIESYCYTQITGTKASQELKDVCDAIMRYARSSAAYIANKTA